MSAVHDLQLPAQGWLTFKEADALRALAAGEIVLELGAFRGRSTVALAQSAELVISVDSHDMWGEDSLPDYLRNVRHLENVVSVVGRFEQIVPHLHDIGLVYIDGEHDRASVDRDLALVELTGARVVALHDWGAFDVSEAAIAAFGRDPDGVVGSLAHYRVRQ